MLEMITPLSYWVLVILWSIILVLYLTKLRRLKVTGGAVAVLLTLLAIDAFRTLFESVYFGLYFNSLFGLLPQWIVEELSKPSAIIIPKMVNIVAGLAVLTLLIRRWIPREVAEREEMIHSLEESQSELQESEYQFRSALMNAPIPIMIHAEDGQVVLINSAWENLSGYTPEDIPTIEDWTSKAYGEKMHLVRADIDALYKANKSVTEGEYLVKTKSGMIRVWDFSSAPLGKLEDGRRRIISMATDITKRTQAEDELSKSHEDLEGKIRERTAELQKANQELEAFSYSVSHDLRAPIRAINGYSEIILKESHEITPETQTYLSKITGNARKMGLLIDGLLTLSRLNRKELVHEFVDMNALFRETAGNLIDEQDGRLVEFNLSELPPCNGDTVLLRQVVANLLENALKYSRNREKAIVEVGSLCEGGKTFYFVKDNGVGFDMRYVDKLFGVFQRLHAVEEFEGTGIGLALSQRIIHRHDGHIRAEAEIDKGTVLYFSIGGSFDSAAAQGGGYRRVTS